MFLVIFTAGILEFYQLHDNEIVQQLEHIFFSCLISYVDVFAHEMMSSFSLT